MAPEQLRGEHADVRTDIYSVGVVLYELTTGSRPFPETFGPRLIDSILHRIPPSVREINSQISPELESVIRKALEKESQRRYGSAPEMLNAIEHIRGNPSVPEIAKTPTLQKKPFSLSQTLSPRKIWNAVVAVLIAAAVSLTVWAFSDRLFVRKNFRPTVAVLGFKNQTASSESDWVSTSLSDMLASELEAKRLELLLEALPNARKVAILNPGDPDPGRYFIEVRRVAQATRSSST